MPVNTGRKTYEKYKDYQYANCDFPIYEWNTIALTTKTLRENTLEQFRKGDVPNLSSKKIRCLNGYWIRRRQKF